MRRKEITMNKNCMENKANVIISAKCIDDREIKDAFGEPVMRICWEAFSCGVFVGMESSEAYVFATDMDAKACISAVWDHWGVTAAVENADRTEGLDGVIKVCIDFVTAFATLMLEAAAGREETA